MVRYDRSLPAAHAPNPSSSSLSISDEGLVLGDGTTLVRMEKAFGGGGGLALETDRNRFDALMAVAAGRSVGIDAFRHIEAADRFWRRGDKALANTGQGDDPSQSCATSHAGTTAAEFAAIAARRGPR